MSLVMLEPLKYFFIKSPSIILLKILFLPHFMYLDTSSASLLVAISYSANAFGSKIRRWQQHSSLHLFQSLPSFFFGLSKLMFLKSWIKWSFRLNFTAAFRLMTYLVCLSTFRVRFQKNKLYKAELILKRYICLKKRKSMHQLLRIKVLMYIKLFNLG